MNIKKKVLALVRKHQSRNPFEIIKGMNVILIFAPLYGVRGFYQYFQRNNIIYIDEALYKEEQIFVCAHELGHSLLHQGYNRIFMDTHTLLVTSRFEQEADYFASELLFDDMELECFLEVSLPTAVRTLGMSPLITARRLSSIRHLP